MEFARVELWDGKRKSGRFWFRISDHKAWQHRMKAVFNGGAWGNSGSSSAQGYCNMVMIKRFFLFAIWLFSSGILPAETKGDSGPFAEMSPGEAAEYLGGGGMYRAPGKLIDAAIKSRRLDLIEVCFKNHEARLQTIEAAGEIKDLSLKDRVVVMMLRTDVPLLWPEERPFIDGHQIFPSDTMREPFSEVLIRHFPDFPKDGKLLGTRASRLELAEKLEKKLGGGKDGEVGSSSRMPERTVGGGAASAETASTLAGGSFWQKGGRWIFIPLVLIVAGAAGLGVVRNVRR